MYFFIFCNVFFVPFFFCWISANVVFSISTKNICRVFVFFARFVVVSSVVEYTTNLSVLCVAWKVKKKRNKTKISPKIEGGRQANYFFSVVYTFGCSSLLFCVRRYKRIKESDYEDIKGEKGLRFLEKMPLRRKIQITLLRCCNAHSFSLCRYTCDSLSVCVCVVANLQCSNVSSTLCFPFILVNWCAIKA